MRPGFHTLTPYMMFPSAAAAIDFYAQAFGAVETHRDTAEGGRVRHAEIRIGDSHIMLSEESAQFPDMKGPTGFGGSPVQMFLYVDDVDAFAARAVGAGAEVTMPISEQHYGKSGGLKDPFGYTWYVCTHKEF